MADTIDFSCFASFRSEDGGVRYGKCPTDHQCSDCEVYDNFYGKADEYQKAGNEWGKSVALAKRFFGIPTVPEYEVEAYGGGKRDGNTKLYNNGGQLQDSIRNRIHIDETQSKINYEKL